MTLDAVEQPLGDVLHGLSPMLKLDLTAEREIADQRVTLHVVSQPVYALMTWVSALLSHNAVHPHGYHWGPLDRAAGERPAYQLWRDSASAAEEQDQLDAPRRRLAEMLRQIRSDAQPSPDAEAIPAENAGNKYAYLGDAYNKAFCDLSDSQIDNLVDGATVTLDPVLYHDEIAANEQWFHDTLAQEQTKAASGQQASTVIEPPAPAIRVVPADQDEEMGRLNLSGKYYVYLDGVINGARVLDGNTTKDNPDPMLTDLPPDTGPRVDLTPYLSPTKTTWQQRGDLGYTLQALGKAAHLNIYQESFLRTSTVFPYNPSVTGGTPPGLDTLQGSVPRLVARICQLWNYQAKPVPGGYLFWSRTWAQDRAWDVPERLVAPWRQRLQRSGAFSMYDRGEIDSTLTWPQVALTLDPALASLLPDTNRGFQDNIGTYRFFNLFGSLSAAEQAQATSPDGLPVTQMSDTAQAALTADFPSQLKNVPDSQFVRAVLKVEPDDDHDMNIERISMKLEADGQKLLDARAALPLVPEAAGTPTKPTP